MPFPTENNLARAREAGRPLFEPLGHFSARGGMRFYFIQVGDEVRRYRASDFSLPTLLEIVPDPAHWQACFPRGTTKIDARAAAAYLIRACWKAGPYVPPEHLCPRGVGRPRKRSNKYTAPLDPTSEHSEHLLG